MEEGTIKTEISDGIASITFFHPQSNSLPGKLLRELATAIRQSGSNPEARVIILRSGGSKAFCAGASFDELISIRTFEEGTYFFSGFAEVINAMRECPKLIIGRVQGKAVGGGVGIAASCDYCFASTSASVKLSELAVGIGPFVVGPAVERKIGVSGLSALSINATEWYPADWALQKGLFSSLHSTEEELDLMIHQLARTLASSSPEAMSELKKVLWEGTEDWDQKLKDRAAISGKLVLSEFTRNAVAAFKQKAK